MIVILDWIPLPNLQDIRRQSWRLPGAGEARMYGLSGVEAGGVRVRPFTTNPSELKISPRRQFMKFFGFWPLVLVGMVALLATVAVLQYRWTNEATIAAELRMGAELESLMLKWHTDFYGELSAVCVAMQVGPDSGARDTWNDYLERYVEWKNAPPHEALPDVYRNPDLVQDIYIWDTNLQTKPELFRLNAGTKTIEIAAVPRRSADSTESPASELNQSFQFSASVAITRPAGVARSIRLFFGHKFAGKQHQYGLAIRRNCSSDRSPHLSARW